MIRVLEDRVVNKIAAGEVVERPAAALKELIENALDAGATDIRVDLKSGGRNAIRVADNGAGMDEHDASLCIERHATSKIKNDEDLFAVRTLGFRGEALPSIAAVSRFELLTRRSETEVGTRVVVEGGVLKNVEHAGCAAGTEIVARSLFFNVPARRKFLRTAQTELAHCVEAVVRQGLVRPDVDISLTNDGSTSIRAPVVSSTMERAADLLGRHGEALVPIECGRDGMTLRAVVSPVGVHKATPHGSTYLYVNDRFVKDSVLRRAVSEAYRGIVPKGRYPTVIMQLSLPVEMVDVNVHPAKTEVRFKNMRDVQAFVTDALRDGLERHGIKRPVAIEARYLPKQEERATVASEPLWSSRPRPAPPDEGYSGRPGRESGPVIPTEPVVAPRPRGAERDLLPTASYRELTLLGQVADTYLICEGGGELVVIDQHAAHERVTLHKIRAHQNQHLGGAQRQLTPIIVELSPPKAAALAPHTEALGRFGIELEPFGGQAFALKQIPEALSSTDLAQLVDDVAGDVMAGGQGRAADDVVEYILSTMACRSSVKAGQRLSDFEMRSLLESLDEVDFSVCAHGRPVVITIEAAELERRFHRT